jgi:hypothetical protein
MRRLDLHPAKKLRNPGRHLRSLHKWTDAFARFNWADDCKCSDQNFVHWRIPIPDKLVRDPHTTPAIRAEVIQCLVDAAANLHAALPLECRHMPVATLIEYPSLFNSEVTLFISPDYFRGFKPAEVASSSIKTDSFQIDVEPSRIDPVTDLDIKLPAGARAGGYFMREIDFEDPGCNREYERWVIAFWTGD